MVENLEVTNGDILLLTEIVGEVIDGGPINSSVSVHVHVEGAYEFVCLTGWQCYKCVWSVCTYCTCRCLCGVHVTDSRTIMLPIHCFRLPEF